LMSSAGSVNDWGAAGRPDEECTTAFYRQPHSSWV
jgi:hypothetical protein